VQPLTDVVADRRRGGGGHRDGAVLAELVEEIAEAEVVRAEVVAPGGDAVRLVDGHQARAQGRHPLQHLGVGQLLGREEQELDRAGGDPLQRLAPLAFGLRRADPDRACAGAGRLDAGDLVVLQGEQRRDDDGRPVDEQSGELVDQRLARAGRRDQQHVLPVEQRDRGLGLAGEESVVVEPLPGGAAYLRDGRCRHRRR